jgi:hypothetical protein
MQKHRIEFYASKGSVRIDKQIVNDYFAADSREDLYRIQQLSGRVLGLERLHFWLSLVKLEQAAWQIGQSDSKDQHLRLRFFGRFSIESSLLGLPAFHNNLLLRTII